ncbi:MAG: lysophospholipid acyltransferase family protein [Flavobacteriales bacterium]|jgi:KDO2-lipid IV(A) lauroyltransferase|nr:lysophospholipid acyltransferase family protein [Flavobacteriales bacterium]HOZ40628.1 lysophospholipid acyltransferase family protein [Flavobacteriales bacterium]
MGTLGYFVALPFIYGISLLPFPLLYLLSDGIYFLIYKVLGYRKEVVMNNLRNSFPEKDEAELKAIASKFYRWFCDLTLETLKTLTISPEEVRKRVEFRGKDILQQYAQEKRSVILVLGHYGNWELAGARYSQERDIPQLYVIFHPLANARFDRLMHHMRTRHGTKLYTMRETSKAMIRDRDLLTATAFIADQTPSPERAYWMNFLNQDTPVFQGTEGLARKLDKPVIYISITRPERGYYCMSMETLVADPTHTRDGEITEVHTRRLERDIRKYPELWLWTHRRWKHRRPSTVK